MPKEGKNIFSQKYCSSRPIHFNRNLPEFFLNSNAIVFLFPWFSFDKIHSIFFSFNYFISWLESKFHYSNKLSISSWWNSELFLRWIEGKRMRADVSIALLLTLCSILSIPTDFSIYKKFAQKLRIHVIFAWNLIQTRCYSVWWTGLCILKLDLILFVFGLGVRANKVQFANL